MATTVAQKRAAFRALHDKGCFVIPNPWDVGSARLLQSLGFTALASTSSGYAWTTGRADNSIPRDDALAHLASIAAAVDVPINADFESGFAATGDELAANVTLAIATGIAGVSIEDRPPGGKGLYPKDVAVERIRIARAAIDRSGQDVMLVARTEGMLDDRDAIKPAIDKLVAFAEAGGDVLYAPGVWKPDDIAAMVRAVAPKPLNVLMRGTDRPVAALADLGVRRISVGGALARVGWAAVIKAAEGMRAGSFAAFGEKVPNPGLDAIFEAQARERR